MSAVLQGYLSYKKQLTFKLITGSYFYGVLSVIELTPGYIFLLEHDDPLSSDELVGLVGPQGLKSQPLMFSDQSQDSIFLHSVFQSFLLNSLLFDDVLLSLLFFFHRDWSQSYKRQRFLKICP